MQTLPQVLPGKLGQRVLGTENNTVQEELQGSRGRNRVRGLVVGPREEAPAEGWTKAMWQVARDDKETALL